MKKIKLFVFLIPGLLFYACKTKNTMMNPTQDVHSFAKPDEALVKHLNLDIKVDFDQQIISGKAGWEIENKTGTKEIILDSKDLSISKVTTGNGASEKATAFTESPEDKNLGKALHISIEPGTTYITVYYKTSPAAGALQWLSPQQTAGKKYPFLFTQSQAILARTWIPCQDGPGVRFSYQARVEVPKGFMAVMSAPNPETKNESGIYEFHQEQKIPSYLMALAAGDLAFMPIGEKTGVYAEPAMIKQSHYEFADMDKMLHAAEKLYGQYRWGRYDVIVLPPSFPFGGMENPCLTFATPTILAGDRSLTSLVAHELAHSWSGNLVTNGTWNDLWLNEGFTVYFERRIMEELYGKSYAEMLTFLGYTDLKNTIKDLGSTNPETKLHLDLKGRNPDDGVSDIAYEKGFFFLKMLEDHVGREKLDAFLHTYFEHFAFTSMNTEKFLVYLKQNLFKEDTAAYSKLKIEQWVYEPGLPENFPTVKSDRFENVDRTLKSFMDGTPATSLQTKDWTSHEWLHFVDALPDNLSMDKMKELDATFHFTQTGNNEILDAWLLLAVKNNYEPAYAALEEFLIHVGRRKFLTPLYKELMKTPEGKILATSIYTKARPNYHFVATHTLDAIVKPEAKMAEAH